MQIKLRLKRAEIGIALTRIAEGLEKYLWIQNAIKERINISQNDIFQRKYNGFYRIRRGEFWRREYFKLMEERKQRYENGILINFEEVLEALASKTGRVEASFASKLVATIDPSQPVIDSIVLKNLGMRLPAQSVIQRIPKIGRLYAEMTAYYISYLKSESGLYLAAEFTRAYRTSLISDTKMLDFILWQTR